MLVIARLFSVTEPTDFKIIDITSGTEVNLFFSHHLINQLQYLFDHAKLISLLSLAFTKCVAQKYLRSSLP